MYFLLQRLSASLVELLRMVLINLKFLSEFGLDLSRLVMCLKINDLSEVEAEQCL